MIVYRVAHSKFREWTLSGMGAEKAGGRWNNVGTRAVYCSENASLALLEYYVHAGRISNLPREILIAKVHFPDEFPLEEVRKLPAQWNQYPYSTETTSLFDTRVKHPDFFALKVPSTIVAIEHNLVLNPLYREFWKVEILEFIPLAIDVRLKKRE
ncbi:MAG: RES family NAD+ phosphorylase [Bacteroidales bacterium]